MLEDTRGNHSTKRKQFYSPNSKKTACPSFLIKNQIHRSQPGETSLSYQKNQDNIRKSHEATPSSFNSQDDQPFQSKLKYSTSSTESPYKIRKLAKIESAGQQFKKINLQLDLNTDIIQQSEQQQNIQIEIHSPSNTSSQKVQNAFDNKVNGPLSKSGDQSTFLNIKKLLFESPLNVSRSSENSPRLSIKSNQQVEMDISFNDFEIFKELGKGKTSKVLLACYKQIGMLMALKVIPKQPIKDQKIQQYIFREIKIHHYVKHQNIITLYNCFSDKDNIYLMLEFMGGEGNLYQKWKKQKTFSEKQTQKIIADICRAVSYLHKEDIIHRDIKLENILFMKGVAKLADLGCAVHSMYMRKSHVGSPTYLSPQQLNNNFYNKKIDIWSIGIITYQLLFGYSPFDQQIEAKLQNSTRKVSLNLSFPDKPQISENAKDFISRMLTKNPNDRYSIQLAILHPFVNQYFKTNK